MHGVFVRGWGEWRGQGTAGGVRVGKSTANGSCSMGMGGSAGARRGLVLMRVAGGGSAVSPAGRAAAWQGGCCVDQAAVWLALVGKGDAWWGRHPTPKFSLFCSSGRRVCEWLLCSRPICSPNDVPSVCSLWEISCLSCRDCPASHCLGLAPSSPGHSFPSGGCASGELFCHPSAVPPNLPQIAEPEIASLCVGFFGRALERSSEGTRELSCCCGVAGSPAGQGGKPGVCLCTHDMYGLAV